MDEWNSTAMTTSTMTRRTWRGSRELGLASTLPGKSGRQAATEIVAAARESELTRRGSPSEAVCQRISLPQADIGGHSYGT